MKFKKAQGLPMNTIVIAAIVLVVLVVIVMIFTGGIGGWTKDVEEAGTLPECEEYRSNCYWVAKGTCLSEDYEVIPNFKLSDYPSNEGKECCCPKNQ